MTGQKFASCPSISSSCTHLCTAVRLAAADTSSAPSTNHVVGVFVDLRVFTDDWRKVGVKGEDVDNILFPTLEGCHGFIFSEKW